MKIFAQVLGLGAMACLFLLYQQKSRRKMLLAKLGADVFWSAHYLCLGGVGGLIPNAVGILRELIFINRKNKRWASLAIWPAVFIIISWTWGILSFNTHFNLLTLTASSAVTISLWIDNPRLTRLISIPVSLSFLIYDIYIGSYVGIINESAGIISIIISLRRDAKMQTKVFTDDIKTEKELVFSSGAPIENAVRFIDSAVSDEALRRGDAFADEIAERFVSDFEKTEALVTAGKLGEYDKMAHVSTFTVMGDYVYMSYYANTKEPEEDPKNQTARLVYAPLSDMDNKTFIDLQTTGDVVDGRIIDRVYDTILMPKDERTLYVLWTARVDENYFRFFCPFDTETKTLGKIGVNRFRVGNTVNDFSASGIRAALANEGVPCKKMYADIGIMQKLSSREENGKTYYYSGAYSGDFTCIIKSCDLIEWEYVSQPDFINDSKWENATYVIGDKCFYFVRQQNDNKAGFLTAYNLNEGRWDAPVEIQDCQSRSDFIVYGGELYLFHAPIDREHIGIIRINTESLADSEVVLQAKMHSSCFYPFIQYYKGGELAMSYTVARRHIRLAEFTLSKYL